MRRVPIQIFTNLKTDSKLENPKVGSIYSIQVNPYYYEKNDGANFGNLNMTEPIDYKCVHIEEWGCYPHHTVSYFRNDDAYTSYVRTIYNEKTGEILTMCVEDKNRIVALEARKESAHMYWHQTPLGCDISMKLKKSQDF